MTPIRSLSRGRAYFVIKEGDLARSYQLLASGCLLAYQAGETAGRIRL